MTREKLVLELKGCLPTTEILRAAESAAVEVGGELIFLKNRNEEEPRQLEYFGLHVEPEFEYKDLRGKDLLLDTELFGLRGKRAIEAYLTGTKS